MEYRFTNTDATRVAMDLTLDEMAFLRKTLEAVLKADLEDVSKWKTRQLIKALADAQGKAAEVMVYEASMLADAAKLSDDI
jgi:hypothetical protein